MRDIEKRYDRGQWQFLFSIEWKNWGIGLQIILDGWFCIAGMLDPIQWQIDRQSE